MVILETERLILRAFTEGDADNLFELDGDPEVMRYLNGGEPTPRKVVENEILPLFIELGCLAAIEKSSGEFIGWFGLRQNADEAHLGYRMRKVAWGKGYATEGARALVRRAFTEFGVRRVVATTYEDNVGSRRVLEKAGFRLVRRFRMTEAPTTYTSGGEPWDGDDLEYALDREP